MKINSYYRQDWAPPGVDPNVLEKTLGEWLEGAAKDSIDRLIHHPASLTDDDTATLLTYIELQRIRVPRQSGTRNNTGSKHTIVLSTAWRFSQMGRNMLLRYPIALP